MTTTMNRSDRRAYAKRAKNKSNSLKGIASFGIATMLLGAGAGMASATEQTQGDGFNLTTKSQPIFGKYMDGVNNTNDMTGTTTIEISDEDKAKLAEAGVSIDIDASNALMAQPWTQADYNESIKLMPTIDKAVAAANPLTSKLTEVYDYRLTMGNSYEAAPLNISTQANFDALAYNKGDVLDPMFAGGTPGDNQAPEGASQNGDFEFKDGEAKIWSPLNRFPVSSFVTGGLTAESNGSVDLVNGFSPQLSTTIIDKYSDGDSAKRLTDVSMGGTQRGLDTSTTVNCTVVECVVPLQVLAYGSISDTPTLDNEGNKLSDGGVVLTDPIYVKVKTTYSAGKTLVYTKDAPFVEADGTKIWLEPTAGDGYMDTKNPVSNTWMYDSEIKAQIAETEANNIPVKTADLDYISVREGQDVSSTWKIAKVAGSGTTLATEVDAENKNSATLTYTGDITTWLRNGEALTAGFQWSAGAGDFTVVSVEDGKLVIKLDTSFDLTGVAYNNSGMLNTLGTWIFPSNAIAYTPSYRVAYEVAPPVFIEKDPTAKVDFVSGKHGLPVIISPTVNDTTSDPSWTISLSSLRIKDPVDGKFKKTVTVEGQGVFEVQKDGTVKFTGVDSFSGKTTALTYQWDEVKHEVNDGVNEGLLGKTAGSTLQAEIIKVDIPEDEPTIPTPDDSTIPHEDPKETPDDSTIPNENNGGGDEVPENNDGGGQDLKIEGDGSGQDLVLTGVTHNAGIIATALAFLGLGGLVTLVARVRKGKGTRTND